MRRHRLLLLLAAALLPACSPLTGVESDQLTFYVAPYTRTCHGLIEMQCMLVRENPNGEWSNFYEPIEGFTYEQGYSYVLIVGWREIPNPPADGSSREYRLMQLVEKTPAPGGV